MKAGKKSARDRELERKIRKLSAAMLGLSYSRRAGLPQFSAALRQEVARQIDTIVES